MEDNRKDYRENKGEDQARAARAVDNGSQELVDKYNINDKAYSDSSKKDFVETVSKFRHAEQDDDKDV